MEYTVKIKKLSDKAKMPEYESAGAAGADIFALLDDELKIAPGATELVHTGIAMVIPEGTVGLVFARSGLATKKGLAPANKVGVIDSDYRGELMVPVHNHSQEVQTVTPGERVAQLVIVPFVNALFSECDELDSTERGIKGFGSTGQL